MDRYSRNGCGYLKIAGGFKKAAYGVAVAVFWAGTNVAADTVLLSDSFENGSSGDYAPYGGLSQWVAAPRPSGGWYPTIKTGIARTGTNSVSFMVNWPGWLVSPAFDVRELDKVRVSLFVCQSNTMSYSSSQYFAVASVVDGGATNTVFVDKGVLDGGYQGTYEGTVLAASDAGGTGSGLFYHYDLLFDVSAAQTVSFRFLGWTAGTPSKTYFIDDVAIIGIPPPPSGTMVLFF